MRRLAILALGVVTLSAQTPAPAPDRAAVEAQGLPPRVAPSDYAATAKAGNVTIAADFTGHSVATPEGILTAPDHVALEVALFGDARLALSADDFTLRINGKKAIPREPYELAVKSMRDPDYEPPSSSGNKKTNLTGSGKSDAPDLSAPPPPPPPVPVEVRRAWEQRVRKISLPSGDRALPTAGLILFPYGGRVESLRSVELIYNGPAGKATLTIHP